MSGHSPNNTINRNHSHICSRRKTLHNTYTIESGTLDISCKSRTTTNVSNWRSRETRKEEKKKNKEGEEKQCRHDTTGGWRRVDSFRMFYDYSVSSSFSDPSIRGKLHWNDPPSSRIIASYSRSFEPVETTTFVRLSDDRSRQPYVIMLPSRNEI